MEIIPGIPQNILQRKISYSFINHSKVTLD